MKRYLKQWRQRMLTHLPFVVLMGSVFLFPLFFLPFTSDIRTIPKTILLWSVIAVVSAFWMIRSFVMKKIVRHQSSLDVPIVVFLGAVFLTTITSVFFSTSLVGNPSEFVLHLSFLCALALWCWFLIQEGQSLRRWQLYVAAFLSSSVGVAILFFLRKLPSVANLIPVGESVVSYFPSALSIYMVVTACVSLGVLLVKRVPIWLRVVAFAAMLLSIATVWHIGFTLGLSLLIAVSVLILVLAWLFLPLVRTTGMVMVFVIGVISTLLIGSNFFGWQFLGIEQSIKAALTTEVHLGVAPSWQITSDALVESAKTFFLGSGPGTFIYDFSLFRPEAFNLHALTWTTRFSYPFSTAVSILVELGIFGAGAIVVVLAMLVGLFLTHIIRMRRNFHPVLDVANDAYMVGWLGSVFALAWGVLTVGAFLVVYDAGLWWLWWLMGVLGLLGLRHVSNTLFTPKVIPLQLSQQGVVLSSFAIVIVGIGVIVGLSTQVRYYLAEVWIQKAANESNITRTQQYISQALSYRPEYPPYQIALARVHLEQTRQAIAAGKQDETVARYMAQAVNTAKQASDHATNNVETWETLALMYLHARSVAPNANAWAAEALEQAIALEPTNPILYFHLGSTHAFSEQYDEAIEAYRHALTLKPNYLTAAVQLAKVYEETGNIDQAITSYEYVLSVDQQHVDALYELGRLLFNRNQGEDVTHAKQLWNAVITLAPNHANALYSLGLLHESLGEYDIALSYYQKLRSIYPEHKEIQAKIQALISG